MAKLSTSELTKQIASENVPLTTDMTSDSAYQPENQNIGTENGSPDVSVAKLIAEATAKKLADPSIYENMSLGQLAQAHHQATGILQQSGQENIQPQREGTGQNAMAQARQNSGISDANNQLSQISNENAPQNYNPKGIVQNIEAGFGRFFGTPKSKEADAYALAKGSAYGGLAPEVTKGIAQAELTPPTQYEKASLQQKAWESQVEMINKQIERFQNNEKMLREEMVAQASVRPGYKKMTAEPKSLLSGYKKDLQTNTIQMAKAYKRLADLHSKRPDFSNVGKENIARGLPSKSQAPKGAKGYDTETGKWVF